MDEIKGWVRGLSDHELFSLQCRARAERIALVDKVADAFQNPLKWNAHYGNYKYAYLFAIRKGKRGIRKYYVGWQVFSLLAANNIRYMLELVDNALTLHLDSDVDALEPISPSIQTSAAKGAGQKNLRELEGLSTQGAKLTRLLLSLGRVFQVMAEDPIGHTPEINQFHLRQGATPNVVNDRLKDVEDLLRSATTNLALLRYPGSKLADKSDVREYDFSVHPIFAAYFGFSHRKKRKIALSADEVWGLVEDPPATINAVLDAQNRSPDDPLPDQLELFHDFYAPKN